MLKLLKKNMVALLLAILILALFSWAMKLRDEHRYAGDWGPNGVIRFLNTVEWKWYDQKMDLKEDERAPGVLVAKIDDASLEKFGRWPWSRGVYSQILDSLYALGAEVVAFDAVFTESEFKKEYLRKNLTESTGQGDAPAIATHIGLSDEVVESLVEALPHVGDQIFAAGVRRHPKTVLGYFWQGAMNCPIYDPENEADKKKFPSILSQEQTEKVGLVHIKKYVDSLSSIENQALWVEGEPAIVLSKETAHMVVLHCPVVNRSALSASVLYQGYFNSIPDRDGLFRRIPLVLGFSPTLIPEKSSEVEWLDERWTKEMAFFPSLTVQALTSFWNPKGAKTKPRVEMAKDSAGRPIIKAVVIPREGRDDFRINTMNSGTLALNFFGSQNFTRYPPIGEFSLANIPLLTDSTDKALEESVQNTWELRDPQFREEYQLDRSGQPLKGKIVVIGPVALGVYDLRPNPVQGDAPGVFLHATAMSRLLALGENIEVGKEGVKFAELKISQSFLWGVGITVSVLLAFLSAFKGATVSLLVIGLFILADSLAFAYYLYAIDSITIVLAMSAVAISIIAYKYFTEERDRAFVKGAFEKYVSPDVVSSILADPKKLNLGGQKKFLSVLFSDIRGFTTISERMEAAELAKFMNDYLSPMTDIILANNGTIDKYMGDAIMAIFGAPIEYENHPERSVRASLEMLKKLDEMKLVWKEQGLPAIDIGIGINSGEMSVGNMGSTRIFSYTVMGDSVNLGSRLEGINKEYGTRLIVSDTTREKLGAQFVCRELDRVKVKGKNLPVTIFEVMAEEKSSGEAQNKRQLGQDFEAALNMYYQKQFSEAKEIFEKLSILDGTSAIYVKRCDLWLADPPVDDWDGSWVMKSK